MSTQPTVLKDELRELAERVEAASESDFAINKAIALAVGFLREPYDFVTATISVPPVPDYMGSLDAAMQLVPEGWVEAYSRTFECSAVASCTFIGGGKSHHSMAATPALALTAAALRARASIKGSIDADL